MRKLIAVAALLALPSVAAAQLPAPIEGLQNPGVVAGVSYLKDAPLPGAKRVQPFLTAGVPLLRIGNIFGVPCSVFGLNLSAGALDPRLSDLQLGLGFPVLTCAPNDGQFIVQTGYAKIVTGAEKPDGYYFGIGFSLTSHPELAAKRAEKAAKKDAELRLKYPTPQAP